MSLENAILELAAAMREQAVAMREGNEVSRQTAAGYEKAVAAYATGGNALVEDKAAELTEVREQRIEATKEAKAQDEITAVSQEIEAADSVEPAAELTPLDYKKDVQPVLLAAIKKAGKASVQEILAQYGAQNGNQLDQKDFPAVVAAAQKLVA